MNTVRDFMNILALIVGLGIVTTIVANGAGSAQVIGKFGDEFAQAIAAAQGRAT